MGLERRVDGEPSAKHGCGVTGFDLVRYREDKLLMRTYASRVATLSHNAIGIFVVLCAYSQCQCV